MKRPHGFGDRHRPHRAIWEPKPRPDRLGDKLGGVGQGETGRRVEEARRIIAQFENPERLRDAGTAIPDAALIHKR
jgi:hypothetical protein